MLAPLAGAVGTWVLVARTYPSQPERLTSLMVAAFGGETGVLRSLCDGDARRCWRSGRCPSSSASRPTSSRCTCSRRYVCSACSRASGRLRDRAIRLSTFDDF